MAKIKANACLTITAVLLAILVLASFHQYKQGHLSGLSIYVSHADKYDRLATNSNWTHNIWQSSKLPAEKHSEDERKLTRTWADLNPTYRHEMVTHERMQGYVEDNFKDTVPELKILYDETTDYMMRTDVLRYLVLLKDGGIYNDLDVECLEPIDTWIPDEYKGKAGVVVGIENDFEKEDGTHVLGLVVWTMMAKPNQPFVRFVLDRLMENMANVTAEQQAGLSTHDLMDITGPAATSVSFMKYASMVTKTEVSYLNFTGMTEPKMVGEVLVLPIWAFGAQHQVAKAGLEEQAGRVLVKHWFAGTWKADHGGKKAMKERSLAI